MNPLAVLERLESLGAQVSLAGDRVHVEAPTGVITDELREALRREKPSIIETLRERESTQEHSARSAWAEAAWEKAKASAKAHGDTPQAWKEAWRAVEDQVDRGPGPPSYPPIRGRLGTLDDPDAILRAVGHEVCLQDGRTGTLRAALHETRSGRLRCRLELEDGRSVVVDPEDLKLLKG